MKWLDLSSALILIPALGYAQSVSYISSGSASDMSGSNVGSISVSLSSLPSGSTLVLAGYANAAVSLSPTDSGGGTFTLVGSTDWDSSNDSQMKVWCLANATAGNHEVTMTLSPADAYPRMFLVALAGANTTSPCSSSQFGKGYSNSASSGNVTVTAAGSMVVGFTENFSTETDVTSSPYTLLSSTVDAGYAAYSTASSSGSYSPSFNLSGTSSWVAATVAVNPGNPSGQVWFIRPDGGTRYTNPDYTAGQCDGKADLAYPGSGTNQHCAFNDVRWMWLDGSYGEAAWVMSGGDTLVIRGCSAQSFQQNADNPHCRIGTDLDTGSPSSPNLGSLYLWCAGVGWQWGCSMPPPPSGTAAAHTKILGGCAYDGNCTPVSGYPYSGNLTQLFGGFNLGAVIYLNGSSYVDLAGLEITSHNGACTLVGSIAYPKSCSTNSPYDDFARWGVIPDAATQNITMTDVYIHGLTNIAMGGPIGGNWNLTRVIMAFNAFAGWNLDDGNGTDNAPGTSVTQSYVSMIGNGCLEEYPITHTLFPAKACWDSNSGGFGDSWSGQPETGDKVEYASWSCDHCAIIYNVKDGALGPHSLVHNLTLTNSIWAGNMGQNWKWGQDAGSTFLARNNLIVANCFRMSQQIPGSVQNFNESTSLVGSYLTNYCRAGGSVMDYFADTGATVNIINNTVVGYQPTFFEFGCYTADSCADTPYNITNNVFVGYTTDESYYPNSGEAPGLYYLDDSSVDIVSSHNIEFGIRNGDSCGTNGTLCEDPLLSGEPSQGAWPPETVFDTFLNLYYASTSWKPLTASPAISGGLTTSYTPTTDYFGSSQTSPPTVGAAVH